MVPINPAFIQHSTAFYESIEHIIKHEGIKQAIKLAKELNLIAKKIALREGFTPIPFRKSNKDGVPAILIPLLPYLKGTPTEKRFALTVTRFYEALFTSPDYSVENIIKPQTYHPGFTKLQEEFKTFCKR